MAAQIKSVARTILETGGVNAISLRATARVIGVTPAALYRYYPSLRALVDSLRNDILEELDVQLGLACRQTRGSADRLCPVARAFRRWALDHPAEFWLALGPPADRYGAGHPGAELGAASSAPGARIPEAITAALVSSVGQERAPVPADSSAPAGFAVTAAWARLYGLVAIEAAGYVSWPPAGADAFFEEQLAELCSQLAGCSGPAGVPSWSVRQ
jgi:AcrR family transcriptional regulator